MAESIDSAKRLDFDTIRKKHIVGFMHFAKFTGGIILMLSMNEKLLL